MRRLPHWRKATWAIVVLVGFAALGVIGNQGAMVEGAAVMTWPLVLIWFLSRPKRPRS